MNKKGFTLIELMGVIILLGILSLIATVSISNTLKEKKHESCEMQLKNIISGAELWVSKNPFDAPKGDEEVVLSLKDLKDGGLVDKDITNPITSELFSDDIKITITRVDNSYKYEIDEEC